MWKTYDHGQVALNKLKNGFSIIQAKRDALIALKKNSELNSDYFVLIEDIDFILDVKDFDTSTIQPNNFERIGVAIDAIIRSIDAILALPKQYHKNEFDSLNAALLNFQHLIPAMAYSNIVADFVHMKEEIKKESEEILKIAEATAADSGVQVSSKHFKAEAKKHICASYFWLAVTVILSVSSVVLAYELINNSLLLVSVCSSWHEFLILTTSKAFGFAVLMFMLVFSTRNYQANRHNAVVNRHRCNSLATYEALVAAAGDKANKDIVLAKAADSIFDPQPSGFSKLGGGADSGGNSIISIQPPTKLSD